MANISRNIHIYRLTDFVFDRFGSYRTRSGKTIPVTKFSGQHPRKSTETRKTHQSVLRAAAIYASFAHTQDAYINKARRNDMTAYSIALIDWLGAPKVLEIDVDAWTGEMGQTIRVKARDNVGVAGIFVVIRDVQGNIMDMGEAKQSQAGSAWWDFTTWSQISMTPFPTVEAIARDHAGNRDSFAIS